MLKSKTDSWIVFIACGEDSSTLHMNGSSSIGEVKKCFQQDHPSGCILKSCSGVKLSDNTLVQDMTEIAPHSKTIALMADKLTRVPLALYKTAEAKFVETSLFDKPEDLHPQVCSVLDVPSHRCFRLRTVDGPLNYDQSLESQGVHRDTQLLVDFEYRVTLEDQWNGDKEVIDMFGSDDVAELFPDSMARRIILDGRAMNCRGDLHDSLTPHLRRSAEVPVQHSRLGMATLVSSSGVVQSPVWPDDTPNEVFRGLRLQLASGLSFERKSVSPNRSFLEQELPDDCILQTFNHTTVVFPDGIRIKVRMCDCATVGELHEEIESQISDSDFFLTFKGRTLESHEMVTPAMSRKGVKLQRINHNIELSLSDGDFTVSSTTSVMRFTDLMVAIAANGRSFRSLVDTVLLCEGCGRRLKKDEEEYQTIPSDCCRIRSLSLKEATTLEVHDRSCQVGSVSSDVATLTYGTVNTGSRKPKAAARAIPQQKYSVTPKATSSETSFGPSAQQTRTILHEEPAAVGRALYCLPEPQPMTRDEQLKRLRMKKAAARALQQQKYSIARKATSSETSLGPSAQKTRTILPPRPMEEQGAVGPAPYCLPEPQPMARCETVQRSRKKKPTSQHYSAAPKATSSETSLGPFAQQTRTILPPRPIEEQGAVGPAPYCLPERQPMARYEPVQRYPRLFFVINDLNIGEPYMEYYGSSLNKFEVELNLTDPVVAGEVKALLAEHVGESPASLQLRRWKADIDGVDAYQAMSPLEGSGFVSTNGDWTRFGLVEDKQRIELQDHHPFPVMPIHKTIVTIFKDDHL